jgi:hypothetical protein
MLKVNQFKEAILANEVTIPLLPCHSINEVLVFYQAMGFEVTYQQEKPNNYVVVQRCGIELHFFSMRDYIPANSYSTCYVRVRDVDALYKALTGSLRQAYGRVPSAGIPRVIPLKNKSGRREFIMVDPGGNWIRIGQVITESPVDEPQKTSSTPLSRAILAADFLADTKGDYAAAAKTLDKVLEQAATEPNIQRVQALVMRLGYAVTLGDYVSARSILGQLRAVELDADEREQMADVLQRADDLEHQLTQP